MFSLPANDDNHPARAEDVAIRNPQPEGWNPLYCLSGLRFPFCIPLQRRSHQSCQLTLPGSV